MNLVGYHQSDSETTVGMNLDHGDSSNSDSSHMNLSIATPMGDSALHYKATDLKPLQSFSNYIPVYGDKTKSPTTLSDEKWKILGKKRIDHLSKYGYSSHREAKNIDHCHEFQNDWQAVDQNVNNTFDNCYILGETKLSLMGDMATNKSNRHSFCEYKPYSTRTSETQKLRFFAPLTYKSIHDFNQHEKDKLASATNTSSENIITDDGHFNLLPLIGENHLANCHNVNSLMKTQTQCASSNEFNDSIIVAISNNQTTDKDLRAECKIFF